MTKRKLCLIFIFLLSLFLIILSINFYLLSRINDQTLAKETRGGIEHQIRRYVKSLKPVYLNKNPKFYLVRNKLLRNFRPINYENISIIWDIVYWWPKDNEIYPIFDSTMGQLQMALQTEPIKLARNSPKGTQLKLLIHLEGKQKVIFKPKWYERDTIIDGGGGGAAAPALVYSGKDRHTSEIFAFYLGAILNMRWTPIAIGRKLSLKQVYAVADTELRNTMIVADNQTQYCLYGKCFYCKETEMICGNADDNHYIEGVMLHLIPGTLQKHRSPWQRTYKENIKALWEENMDYCDSLKPKLSAVRLLDLIDVAIFDFIIQNGDRHHYETRNDRIVLIDNGKGFGNYKLDFYDILAPLYQCCQLRRTTWERLLYFSGGTLSELIDQLTKIDLLYPILTKEHLKSIERRLLIVYATVELCFERTAGGIDNVLK